METPAQMIQPPQALPPEQMESGVGGPEVMVHHYPPIKAGTCEWCGLIDPHQPATVQYRLCPHFKNMQPLHCIYCPAEKDPIETIRSHTLNVYDHPYQKDGYGRPKKIVVCSETECERKHRERFKS